MAVLIAGGLAVAGLVGWAVTRSMQAPAPSTAVLEEPAPAQPLNPQATATASFPTTTAPHQQDAEHAAVPRIEVPQLKQQVATGNVTLIDVRDMASFLNEHMPNALNIPLARIQAEAANLPKDKPIVAYCT